MRSILCLSVLALATGVAAAQYDPRYGAPGGYDDELRSVQDQLETLQLDRRVQRNAGTELARAESFIDQLAESPPHTLRDEDFEHANMLLEQAREVALERAEMRRQARRGEHRGDRDVVIVERDERARAEAERARHDADLARAEAEAEREAARAAQLEAEQERERNEELMSDLRGMRPRETERGVVVTLGDVLFEVGRSDLRASALGTLRELTLAMRENPEASVIIEGHTDSTGSRSFNQTLSERRANAVRSFLTRQGIAAARIQTRGLGPDVPIASNRTAAGRAQNWRVEVIVQG
jgi:outer membrane protein OmpA-like peptidoglycan-associated protein